MRQTSDVREQEIAFVARLGRLLRLNGAIVVLGALLCGFIALAQEDLNESLWVRVIAAIVFLLGGVGGGAWMIRKGTALKAVSAEMKKRMVEAK